MSPRPYRLGRRELFIEETRQRVVDAALSVFSEDGYATASLDDVARRAGVSRATVYYQFESKTGLLEAAIEAVAARSRRGRMQAVRESPQPRAALLDYISDRCQVWEDNRDFLRNVAGIAVLEPEVAALTRAYDVRQREGLTWIVKRLYDAGELAPEVTQKRAVDFFWALSSFRSYDHLRRYVQTPPRDTVNILRALAETLLAPATGAA
jgi:AcrR family transcriptional regulator